MGLKTLAYFIVTTAISSTLGIILALGINPGKGFILETSKTIAVAKAMSVKEMIFQIFPTDLVGFLSGGNMLFLIIVSIGLGVLIILWT